VLLPELELAVGEDSEEAEAAELLAPESGAVSGAEAVTWPEISAKKGRR